ncbi:hypothetical protein Q9L58_008575 [Maublancomyces gigas]|uniref:Uncharacterized protein n=1 Tax=Discina gigas TaxID=1032678 RepID=A0ABR3G9E3_9PEZI
MPMIRPKNVVTDAETNIHHVCEEISRLSEDLHNRGVCIVQRYNLRIEDIKWPPREQYNYLHRRITEVIDCRGGLPPPPTTAAANMVNRLLDMMDILDPWVKVLFRERYRLSSALVPGSVWSMYRSVFTGQCWIDDRATCDLVDRWACHKVENDNGNEWGVAMESARKCIADAKDIIRKAPVVAAKAEECGEEEPKAELYDSSRATEQGVTATGAAKRSCGDSRRRGMKETVLPV